MKCLERNKRTFFYSAFLRREPLKDAYGNESGESRAVYADPVAIRANISPATGYAQTEQFGASLQYDKVIVLEECPFDENAVLFIDKPPQRDTDGNLLYDYIVKKIARSLNGDAVAVSRVAVS